MRREDEVDSQASQNSSKLSLAPRFLHSALRKSGLVLARQDSRIQDTPIQGQALLYLVMAYLLAVSAFYLTLALAQSPPLRCPLICQHLVCSCQLGRATWDSPSLLDLAWTASPSLPPISAVQLVHNNTTFTLPPITVSEGSCFPSGCQVLLGVINGVLPENSLLSIEFRELPPNSLEAVFHELNEEHPQLSASTQLTAHLLFALLVGLGTFLRKQLPGEDRGHGGRKQLGEKGWEAVPAEVEEVDREVEEGFQRASDVYRELLQEGGEGARWEGAESLEEGSMASDWQCTI